MVKRLTKNTLKTTNVPIQKKKLSKRFNKLALKKADRDKKAIVYIGHLPKGFNELELKNFFTQFGKVSKHRVSRSPKTGRPRGYAFLEFEDKEVAEQAVKTMNGYIMFGRQITCQIVEDAHKDTFKNGNKKWKYIPTQVKFRNKKNAEKSEEEKALKVKGLLQKEKEKRDRFKELGIQYEFPGFQAIVDSYREAMESTKKTKVEDKSAKKQSKKKKK